jgi:hypothetical protein
LGQLWRQFLADFMAIFWLICGMIWGRFQDDLQTIFGQFWNDLVEILG